MSEYLVLARKYRSTTFDEVVGQEHIAQTLVNAIKTGRIAHAYLFTGTRGVGKTTVARILAKALNCLSSDGPTIEPCNECDACKSIARGEDVDVVEIDGASNRGIDEIRELRANAIFRPARCRYKIYYIDEVHMLTKEAFNALLKTLEEPPGHVKFIFATTETEKVPATILSRCQKYDFRNIATRKIADHLRHLCTSEKVQADDDALFRVARAGAGSMRDALSLLDQLLAAGAGKVTDHDVVRVLGTPAEERTLALVRAIANNDAGGALVELNAVLEGGVSLLSAANSLADAFRNMMLAGACGAKTDLIELPEMQRAAVVELAGKLSLPAIVQAVGIMQSLLYKVRSSSMARGLVEAAIVRLAMADKFVDPTSLVERLEALSSGRALPPAAGRPAPRYGAPAGPMDVKKNSIADQAAPGGCARPNAAPAARPAPAAPAAAPRVQPPAPPAPAPVRPGGDAFQLAPAPATPSSIVWREDWLAANWNVVLEELSNLRQGQAVGLLRAAGVGKFDGKHLRLEYAPSDEAIRQRCAGTMFATLNKALSDLAGFEIMCEFVPAVASPAACGAGETEQPGVAAPAVHRQFGNLSLAEKEDISKDPSVQAVVNLFGGTIIDYQRQALSPQGDEND